MVQACRDGSLKDCLLQKMVSGHKSASAALQKEDYSQLGTIHEVCLTKASL